MTMSLRKGFTDLFIDRPVLATVLSIIVVMLGLVTMKRLAVREYPNIAFPKVSVITQLEGASPDIVEALITKPLESALSGIEGIDTIISQSSVGESRVSITFESDRKIEDAANDVRDRVARIRDRLPRDITEPRIRKADADATPVIELAVTSKEHLAEEMADYIQRYLLNQFEAIKGVSSVEVFGGGMYQMHLFLDPVKMASFNLTTEDVVMALKRQNVEKPAGQLHMSDRDIIVTTSAALSTAEDFNNLIITEKNGYLVRLQDIGEAKLSGEDRRNRIRFNGKNAVTISIIKQSVANPLDISRALDKLLPHLKDSLPRGMKIHMAYDSTEYIDQSLSEVRKTIFEATTLVTIVVLLTLGSLRAVWIPTVTIPISLIGTFALMYAFGFTVNILTLLALVLAIGLVVDDAIVVLENIYRHIEEGMSPLKAAFKGAQEVRFAVVAMTLTLAAVYAPIALTPGLVGQLFTEFAVTLAGAVIISGFVALTLSPMMCSRLLKAHQVSSKKPLKKNALERLIAWLDKQFIQVSQDYENYLNRAFQKKGKVLFFCMLVALLSLGILKALKSELNSKQDTGIIASRIAPPYGANLEYVDKYMVQIEKLAREVPEVKDVLAQSQTPGEPTLRIMLHPLKKRSRTSGEIAKDLDGKLEDITGLSARTYSQSTSIISGGGTPFVIVLQSTKPYKELVNIADKFSREIARDKNLIQVYPDVIPEGQEFVVEVDREKAASLGVDVNTIGDVLDTVISGRVASYFRREGKRYPVRVEVQEEFRRSPEDLSSLFIRSVTPAKPGTLQQAQEKMVPLKELVTIKKRLSPTEIRHFGGVRSVTILGQIREGGSLGGAIDSVRKMRELLPDNVRFDFSGESRRYLNEQSSITMVYGMALIFIFLILAAQYESFVDPFIILLSVPLSLSGGALFLFLFGGTINLYSQIGFVTLIGLITKHAILIVDFANAKVEEGIKKEVAIIEAAKLRLRPILMTTFAMVIGALPLMFATGTGYETRRQIGTVIVGGMSLGTIFTLVIVPIVYTIISRRRSLKT